MNTGERAKKRGKRSTPTGDPLTYRERAAFFELASDLSVLDDELVRTAAAKLGRHPDSIYRLKTALDALRESGFVMPATNAAFEQRYGNVPGFGRHKVTWRFLQSTARDVEKWRRDRMAETPQTSALLAAHKSYIIGVTRHLADILDMSTPTMSKSVTRRTFVDWARDEGILLLGARAFPQLQNIPTLIEQQPSMHLAIHRSDFDLVNKHTQGENLWTLLDHDWPEARRAWRDAFQPWLRHLAEEMERRSGVAFVEEVPVAQAATKTQVQGLLHWCLDVLAHGATVSHINRLTGTRAPEDFWVYYEYVPNPGCLVAGICPALIESDDRQIWPPPWDDDGRRYWRWYRIAFCDSAVADSLRSIHQNLAWDLRRDPCTAAACTRWAADEDCRRRCCELLRSLMPEDVYDPDCTECGRRLARV